MFKHIAIALTAIFLWATGANAAVVPFAPGYSTSFAFSSSYVENDFTTLIASCPNMYFDVKTPTNAVLSLYPVDATDNTAALIEAETRIAQFTEGKVYGPYTPSKSFVRLIIDRREASAQPTTVDVSCGTGVATYAVPSTPLSADVDALTYTATTPAAAKSGWGVGTEATPAFTGTLYTDSGPEPTPSAASELNNMVGWYYNKAGVLGAAIPNMYEHAYDFSMENSYRPAGSTIVEWNWDFYPPRVESTLSGATGSFVAGDVLTFSGGGSGVVISSGPPLRWRQNYGTALAGETVTNQTRSGGGTLGTVSQVAAVNYRPFLFTYDTMTDASAFNFDTTPNNTGDATDVSISAGYLRHHNRIVQAAIHAGTSTLAGGTVIAAGACNTSLVGLSGTGFDGTQTAVNDIIRWNFTADVSGITGFTPASTGALNVYTWAGANTVNFKICNPTASSITTGGDVTISWIVDRYL